MCRQLVCAIALSPGAARNARRAVTVAARAWSLMVPNDLPLIASELVTNAVLHARTPISLELCVAAGVVEVAVVDDAAGQPTVRPGRADLLGDLDAVSLDALDLCDRHPDLVVGAAGGVAAGRGLLLVEALADRWGVTPRDGGGKAVWAQLSARQPWTYDGDCRCAGSSAFTAGGAAVRHITGPWDHVAGLVDADGSSG